MARKSDIEGYVVKTSCDGKGVAYRYGDEKLFIVSDAFRHSINKEVPVVWLTCSSRDEVNHDSNIIGFATLEQKWDGVYAHISLRDNNLHTRYIRSLLQGGEIHSLTAVVSEVDIIGNKLIHANIEKISVALSCLDGGEPFICRGESNTGSIYSFAKIDTETAV